MKPTATLVAILSLLTGAAFAQSQKPTLAERQGVADIPATHRYENTQSTPTGTAFFLIATILANDEDVAFSVQRIASHLDVDEAEAMNFYNQIVATYNAMQQEADQLKQERACEAGNGYEILASMYDISEQVQEKHYNQLMSAQTPKIQTLFNKWLSEAKSEMTYIRFDHEEVDRRRGNTRNLETLTKICQGA